MHSVCWKNHSGWRIDLIHLLAVLHITLHQINIKMRILGAVIVNCLLVSVSCYPYFQEQIPNGDRVPHPCNGMNDVIWEGVGHKNFRGGGERNPFGLDFHDNNYVWTPKLCRMDSDGDGKTNGEELGDPGCNWQPGSSVDNSATISHPGVCEPVNSAQCMKLNDWQICDQKPFSCRGAEEQGVKTIHMQLKTTQVPATETNYYCQLLKLPSDKVYDIIADEPILDNKNVIHHMLLYGCDGDLSEFKDFEDSPQPCGMLVQGVCGHILAGWTVGGVGDCFDGIPAGTRIGPNHFKIALLEVHWNNPQLSPNYVDGSGITLYYTEKLRPYPIGVLTVGQMGLMIPPGLDRYTETSTCTSGCTTKLEEEIYIVSAGLHMHYAGRAGTLDLYRGARHVTSIIDEKAFSYDKPLDYNHIPPIVMMPGDRLEMSCTFETKNKKDSVYYGDATSDEMCYSFLTYFPKTNFTECIQMGSHSFCESESVVGGCDVYKEDLEKYIDKVHMMCNPNRCTDSCYDLFTKSPPACLKKDGKKFLEWVMQYEDDARYKDLPKYTRSCDLDIYEETKGRSRRKSNAGSATLQSTFATLMAALIVMTLGF